MAGDTPEVCIGGNVLTGQCFWKEKRTELVVSMFDLTEVTLIIGDN